MARHPILVTGATGYIGGRLVPLLLEQGHPVRVMVRDPERLQGRSWRNQVECIQGDVLQPETLERALHGVRTAYYLIHAMHGGKDFEARDRQAAQHFAQAAKNANIRHVIYLGGLLPKPASDSPPPPTLPTRPPHATSTTPHPPPPKPHPHTTSSHLESRAEVGRLLRDTTHTTEFRAGPVIGSGSGSFEMVRYLTERLPMMVAPKWIDNAVQPIAIRDVLSYLVAALDKKPLGVVEIGGDVLTFRTMMLQYAEARGLRRRIIDVPVLAPGLAGLWVGLVTPIPNRLAVPLIQGIVQPVTADLTRAHREFPNIHPIPYRTAVQLALERVRDGEVATRWSGALGDEDGIKLEEREGLIREERTQHVEAPPQAVYDALCRLGGEEGWPAWDWAWRIRGAIDRLAGGPGLRRGRRHPTEVHVGETIDFWRVEAMDPPHLLRLRAEMRLPGRAWLEWRIEHDVGTGGSILRQTALFAPRGLAGALYWHALYPIHGIIFSRLAEAVAREVVTTPLGTPQESVPAPTGRHQTPEKP